MRQIMARIARGTTALTLTALLTAACGGTGAEATVTSAPPTAPPSTEPPLPDETTAPDTTLSTPSTTIAPSPSGADTSEEFCRLYLDMSDWSESVSEEEEFEPEWANEIVRRMTEMRPLAPPELVEAVEAHIAGYTAIADEGISALGGAAAGLTGAVLIVADACGLVDLDDFQD